MANIDIATPASSAPTDRLALGVGWVRPGGSGIGGTLGITPLGFYLSMGAFYVIALRVMKSSTLAYH